MILIDKLVEFCRRYDFVKNDSKLEECLRISNDRGRLIVFDFEGDILGYVESWRVNFEQFGRLILDPIGLVQGLKYELLFVFTYSRIQVYSAF